MRVGYAAAMTALLCAGLAHAGDAGKFTMF